MTPLDERLEHAPFGVLSATSTGRVKAANQSARALLGLDDADVDGANISTVFPQSVERTVPRAFEEPEAVENREFEEYYPDIDRWLSVDLVPSDAGVTIYLVDVTDHKRTDQTVEELQGELDRMMVTDSLVSEILSALVDASTREEIAETICARLGNTDLYEFAWVGERDIGDDSIVVRASAGATGRMLDPIQETLDAAAATPEERAVETGEIQVVQPLANSPSVPDSVRQAAFAGGLQSLLAIPLTYGSTVYGVVGLYATGKEAITARERESFRTVGEMAGFAVNAARHRTLLLSDRIIEVTFRVSTEYAPLASIAGALGVTVTLDGMVPQRDGGLICYVVVDDANPDEAATLLAGTEGSIDARVVTHEEKSGLLEAELESDTPLGMLLSHGATINRAEYDDGTGRIIGEFPPEENVRRVADALSRRFGAEVVAKREREREVTTPTEFRDELRDRLTEKQETALRTAFFAEYFESPRGSSAEEVADALGVTGPTLLYHLRAGQRKLLQAFFDAKPTAEPSLDGGDE